MSGGAFDYNQYRIREIADQIDHLIEINGRPKTQEELKEEIWRDPDWYVKYPEDKNHYRYSDKIMEEFKNASRYLRIAEIYAQRVDWLISGDDSEESFLKRLKSDLETIEKITWNIK